jgi:hypothetical protein
LEKHRPVIFARPGPFPWFVDAESDASPALGYLSSRSEQAEAVRCSARPGVALIRQWHWTLAAMRAEVSPTRPRTAAPLGFMRAIFFDPQSCADFHRFTEIQLCKSLQICGPAAMRRQGRVEPLNHQLSTHQLRLVGPLMTLAG